MSRSSQNPSRGWKGGLLDAGFSLAVAVIMLLIGISTGRMLFVFMAVAVLLIGGGEALRVRAPGLSHFFVQVGRVGMLVSLAYVVIVLIFGSKAV